MTDRTEVALAGLLSLATEDSWPLFEALSAPAEIRPGVEHLSVQEAADVMQKALLLDVIRLLGVSEVGAVETPLQDERVEEVFTQEKWWTGPAEWADASQVWFAATPHGEALYFGSDSVEALVARVAHELRRFCSDG